MDTWLVVTYSISTSNHNMKNLRNIIQRLWLILFLHQTTTRILVGMPLFSCDLFYFYIKPQHSGNPCLTRMGCDLFYFYIKPQLWRVPFEQCLVVTYSISTSNHNSILAYFMINFVVTYSISTSNHNLRSLPQSESEVVTYSISTSNHNHKALNY